MGSRDVVQQKADYLGGVHPGWHRNHLLALRQADVLRVCPVDGQRGHNLTGFDS